MATGVGSPTKVPVDNRFVTEVSRTNAELQAAVRQRRASEEKKDGAPLKTSRGEIDITEHNLSPPECLKLWGCESIEKGLTTQQVAEGVEKWGRNELTPSKKYPWYCLMWDQMTGFFSLLLWLAAALCYFAYALDQTILDYLYLGIVLTVVTFLTGIFSFYQEYQSAAVMEGFKKFLPKESFAVRNGKKVKLNSEELVRGDIVEIPAGGLIPADLRVLSASDFKVDNSSLTGESDAQTRTTQNVEENPIEATNLCFLGTMCTKGKCTGLVIRTGDSTLIGCIAHMAEVTEQVKTPIAHEIEHFIHIVSSVAVFLGVTFLIIGFVRKEEPITNLVFMIGIIVANVPEGLLATVTVSLTLTSKRMATKQVLVKNLEAVETLGSTTVIASDKTGTLTQNRMTAVELYFDTTTYPVLTEKERSAVADKVTFDKALMVMALCNNAIFLANEENLKIQIQQRDTQGDASESALLKVCEKITQKSNLTVEQFRKKHAKIGEIPFNSTNKYQVSVHTPNNNEDTHRLLVMKGAPERVWNMCSFVNIEGKVIEKSDEHKEDFDNNINEMMYKGERVLGLCYAELDPDEWKVPDKDANGNYKISEELTYDPSKDDIFGQKPWQKESEQKADKGSIKLTFCGLIALIDPPRPTVPQAVQQCQKAGIKVIMVTGDHPETAESIARKVYIIRDKTERDIMKETGEKNLDASTDERIKAIVIPGKRLATLTPEELDNFLDYDQIVFARTSPAQKLKIVEGLQKKTHIRRGYSEGEGKPVKHIVAVTGDGVNDSPALKQADIGIAMGIAGTEVSKDAADMILLDDNFASIVKGVEEGRLIFDNLKKSIAYTLSSNIPEISPFLVFILVGIPLPLPTILILGVDLGTDMVPAISLAYEGKEANIMTKPPRDARVDRLVTGKLVCFSYLQVGVIQAAAGFYAYVVVLKDFGFAPSSLPNSFFAFEKDSHVCMLPNDNNGQPMFSGSTISKDYLCGQAIVNNTLTGGGEFDAGPLRNGFYLNGRDQVWTTLQNDYVTPLTDFTARDANKNGFQMWARSEKLADYVNWQHVSTMSECWVSPWTATEPSSKICWNPAEALMYAQTAFFISIIIVQWADILACKTRTLSLQVQGMRNNFLSFGLFFETALGALLCYVPPFQVAFSTRPIYFVHWCAPLPFMILILSYDEMRKLLMRNLSKDFSWGNKDSWLAKKEEGLQPENWVYRNTYY